VSLFGSIQSRSALNSRKLRGPSQITLPRTFLPEVKTFQTPVAADFIGVVTSMAMATGDLVVASRNGNALAFLIGDGQGNFVRTEVVQLAGK